MKYDWDLAELQCKNKPLNGLANDKELSKGELIYLKEMLLLMKNSHQQINSDCFNEEEGFYDKYNLIPNSSYIDYISIFPYIRKIMSSSSKIFGLYNPDYNYTDLPFINRNELIDICYDIYIKLPTKNKTYLKLFKKYTNPSNHTIKFINNPINSNSIYNNRIIGYTYFLDYPEYKPYILMSLDDSILDILTLCHEIAHAIMYSGEIVYDRSYYLGEVEGFLFERYARQYIQKEMQIDDRIINELEHREFESLYNQSLSSYIMDTILKKYNKNKDIACDEIIKYIKNKVESKYNEKDLSEFYIIENLKASNYSYARYLISYLTYLDIVKIDEKDSEKAFNVFEKISSINKRNLWNELRENAITFMDDGFKNLNAKVLELNNTKNL